MAEIISPQNNGINGPWILDKSALEELDSTISHIKEKVDQSFELVLEKAINSKYEDMLEWSDNYTIEDAKKRVMDSLHYNSNSDYVLLSTKEGDVIKEDSILLLLKNPSLEKYTPDGISVSYSKGPCEFNLEIIDKYRESFKHRVKVPDPQTKNDINYYLANWTDKFRPTKVKQIWSGWFPGISVGLLLVLLLITALSLESASEQYDVYLNSKIHELLKDGVQENETTTAIELVLAKSSKYVPSDFKPQTSMLVGVGWAWIAYLVSLILNIKPTTTIGIGKNKRKIGFYKIWTYVVTVVVPSSILLPIIIDLIKSQF